MTSFNTQLQESIDMIVDTCIYHEGKREECELKQFCECGKPIEYIG